MGLWLLLWFQIWRDFAGRSWNSHARMKKILLSSTFILLFGLASAGAAETNSAPAVKPEPKKEVAKPVVKPASTNASEVAVLKTSEGEMVLE